jgi:hypothetical protein
MSSFHNSSDSYNQLRNDIKLGDNPQHPDNPDSVRNSARNELSRRGFSHHEIDRMEND